VPPNEKPLDEGVVVAAGATEAEALPNVSFGPAGVMTFLLDAGGFISGLTYSQHGHLNSSFVLVTSHLGHTHDPSAAAPPHWKGASLAGGGGAAAAALEEDEEEKEEEDEEEEEEEEERGSSDSGTSRALSLMTNV